MTGIVSYGAYVPIYRLSWDAISAVWGTPLGKGERAVANADEDTITLAVEAVIDCLSGADRSTVDSLYLASTSFPYREKQSASIVRVAADLRDNIPTIDFANSLRAGTNALRAGLDAVKGGSAKKVVVAASDCRLAAPKSASEPTYGDGSAAFLLGDTDVAVEVEASYSTSSAFLDVWRRDIDRFPVTWEDRFLRDEGYEKIYPSAIKQMLKNHNLTPKDFTKAVFYAPDAREHATLARMLGFDPKTQVQDPMFGVLGDTGCASAPMMLVAALENAKAGDRILFATYGDGVDVYILKVTDMIEKVRDRRGIKRHLASKLMLPSYGKYLEMRKLVDMGAEIRPRRTSSAAWVWRDRKLLYGLIGQKCRVCGNVQTPRQRICMYCFARDNFDDVRLSDKKGKVFTFSKDDRTMEIMLPFIRVAADLEGGGRFYSAMTDADHTKVAVGMECEMTFRRVMDGNIEGGGFHNYFWRIRPVRC